MVTHLFAHPSHPADLHLNVQVAFSPPPPQLHNHAPKEQLLTLKCFIYDKHWCDYLEWWAKQISHRLSEFWKSFNIWHVLENILAVWDLITTKTINGVWKAVWKGYARSSKGSEEKDEVVAQTARLWWRAASDKTKETSIQENYVELNALKETWGKKERGW